MHSAGKWRVSLLQHLVHIITTVLWVAVYEKYRRFSWQCISDYQFDVCETVHHYNNDVSNQQIATIFFYWSFIDLFESALHVSGDKLAHLQEHFWLYIQLWYNVPVGSNIGALYQSCKYSQKCSWRWASLSPETCRVDSNRSINQNCCILLVAYIVDQIITLCDVKFCSFIPWAWKQ